MNPTAAFVMAAATLAGPPQEFDDATRTPRPVIRARDLVNEGALGTLMVIDNILVPAVDPGKVTAVSKTENDWTTIDEAVALLEEEQVRLRERAATLRVDAASKAVETAEFELKAAAGAAAVAQVEYEESQEIVRDEPAAITRTQLRRENLTAQRARLQAEAADSRLSQTTSELNVARAELDEATHLVGRRKVICPIAGKVVEVLKKRGEWAQAGDPIMRVVRMDRLRVEFYLSLTELRPDAAEGAAVEVHVDSLNLTLPSRVTFVNAEIEGDQTYKVWAEIDNPPSQRRNNAFILAPGEHVRVTLKR